MHAFAYLLGTLAAFPAPSLWGSIESSLPLSRPVTGGFTLASREPTDVFARRCHSTMLISGQAQSQIHRREPLQWPICGRPKETFSRRLIVRIISAVVQLGMHPGLEPHNIRHATPQRPAGLAASASAASPRQIAASEHGRPGRREAKAHSTHTHTHTHTCAYGRSNANLLTKLGIVASLPITNRPDPAPPSLASSKATVTHDKGELANTYTLDNNRPRDKNECHQAFPPLANQLGLSTGPVQHKASSELLGPAIQAANPSFVPELSAGSPQCPTADLPDEEILAVKAAADESRILVRVMVLATLFAPAEEILPQVIAPLTAVSSTSWIVERP
ncbi:hypothetical protein COCC4DRAFT_63739 [Bipolaris maydis ATCC 48331]|uniref:Uncharacterized protein n=1 Tax=Cochliobolus heterostrophus (strain C4 / ATCC 48331 / race T) TaxID=665024 RepID=N4XAN6_COCH4|nr:uncharacterized protein COCC4DRAFT_63739 [Bipolaris maydis ATCC 48331]ENI02277.1 hypothetical protein COCC4DRAFT_63739 [Bipolaris maydis ATCC 48331]